jgi:hypothetical protein
MEKKRGFGATARKYWKYAPHFCINAVLSIVVFVFSAIVMKAWLLEAEPTGILYFLGLFAELICVNGCIFALIKIVERRQRADEELTEWRTRTGIEISPEFLRQDKDRRAILQPVVNCILTILARDFHRTIDWEARTKGLLNRIVLESRHVPSDSPVCAETAKNLLTTYARYAGELEKATEAVRATKTSFWLFHSVCSRIGFTMKNKYTDYL